jgi:hypothetical protein
MWKTRTGTGERSLSVNVVWRELPRLFFATNRNPSNSQQCLQKLPSLIGKGFQYIE